VNRVWGELTEVGLSDCGDLHSHDFDGEPAFGAGRLVDEFTISTNRAAEAAAPAAKQVFLDAAQRMTLLLNKYFGSVESQR
jgi:hypothetical protein